MKLFKDSNLVIAGDIGYPHKPQYENFLLDTREYFKNVIFTSGNHEYFQNKTSINEVNDNIKRISEKANNLLFLNKTDILIDNIRYLGCTLWSHIPQKFYKISESSFNWKEMNITIDEANSLHDSDVSWLKRELEENKNIRTVIVTHYLPSFDLIHPIYKKYGKLNHCFASNLDYMFQENVILWIAGHTHASFDIIKNKTRIVINPLGHKNSIELKHLII